VPLPVSEMEKACPPHVPLAVPFWWPAVVVESHWKLSVHDVPGASALWQPTFVPHGPVTVRGLGVIDALLTFVKVTGCWASNPNSGIKWNVAKI